LLPMRCPTCGCSVVIVLVHSRRALCAKCMHQWMPIDGEVVDLTGAAEVAEALAGIDPDRPAPRKRT